MRKAILAWLAYGAVRLLHATYRITSNGAKGVTGPQGHDHCILAIWHQNLFAGILAQTGRRHVVIVSRSRDGDLVSMLCLRLGHQVARGSSKSKGRDKGGKLAKDDMIALLRTGLPGAVTVDGPRGPAHEVKPGIIEMARQTGIPIVPYLPLPTRYWRFNSWDHFRLPKPFSRIDIHYGAPIFVPENTSFEEFSGYQNLLATELQLIETAATK